MGNPETPEHGHEAIAIMGSVVRIPTKGRAVVDIRRQDGLPRRDCGRPHVVVEELRLRFVEGEPEVDRGEEHTTHEHGVAEMERPRPPHGQGGQARPYPRGAGEFVPLTFTVEAALDADVTAPNRLFERKHVRKALERKEVERVHEVHSNDAANIRTLAAAVTVSFAGLRREPQITESS